MSVQPADLNTDYFPMSCQGYGLTETCAATFLSDFNDPSQGGTVGVPVAGVKFRLEAVAEMGYDPIGQPPTGEVCVRGPCLFKGYYKQDDLTKKEMDEDGFFHTGDVGEVTKKGALRIIDRKKNMFKLSQGRWFSCGSVHAVMPCECPAWIVTEQHTYGTVDMSRYNWQASLVWPCCFRSACRLFECWNSVLLASASCVSPTGP